MSRSGYTDDCEFLELYRASVDRAIRGKRGQKFLRDLAAAMDSMPEKSLIQGDLIDDNGQCCAIGSLCKYRGLDVSSIDAGDSLEVGNLVDIARSLAAEVAYENDEAFRGLESPEQRWQRMRKWVDSNIIKDSV